MSAQPAAMASLMGVSTRPLPLGRPAAATEELSPQVGEEPRGLLLRGALVPRSGPADASRPVHDDLAMHLRRVGPLPRVTAELLVRVEETGLTGHGGAHVPVAVKWRSARRGTGPLTVVANGAESEPLSAKDATLLRQRPHLVLDGLLATASLLGAVRAVVWLHGDDHRTAAAIETAIGERWSAGLPGRVDVVVGPSHYLAGESSAIAQALHGGPALPTVRRPGSTTTGRTLVHNVETLARVALLARGHDPVPTVLLTVLTDVGRQVLEVGTRTPLVDVLGLVDPHATAPQAVLLGGYGGTWVSGHTAARLTVDEADLRREGLSIGAGVVVPLGPEACGLSETAAVAHYLASMSARQCGPCLFGLPAIAETVTALADGRASRRDLARLRQDLAAVTGRGACHHPDGATRLVASALEVFAADVDGHGRRRPCAAARFARLPLPPVLR
ncbi:MAG TPA: NADH-ubiquinone oxidoreductase-F iron-sulfur binding region domain-containing protein [Actinotalea sp.]